MDPAHKVEYDRQRHKQELQKQPGIFKIRKLWSRYRITPEQYAAIFKKQKSRCALCGEISKKLQVDHVQTPNGPVVRGLLCITCNTGLGKLGDTIEGLLKAITYLGGKQ